jgi:hypothetical protein
MVRRKFRVGIRVQAKHDTAPEKFKGRIGIIRKLEPYLGYGIEFEDTAGSIEFLQPQYIEEFAGDGPQLQTEEVVHPRHDYFEQRRSPRFEVDCFVAIEFQSQRVVGTCVDYNEHGFGAIVDEELPAEQVMSIELPIADRKPLRFLAKVAYRKHPRYGFEFVTAKESERQRIVDFFRESSTEAH